MFFQLSFPQLFVYGKSKNVCVGWMGDWIEISAFTLRSRGVSNLSIYISGESGLFKKR